MTNLDGKSFLRWRALEPVDGRLDELASELHRDPHPD